MKRLIAVLMMLMLGAAVAESLQAGSADVAWDSPTKWTDGTPLNKATDLSGIRVKYGSSAGSHPNVIVVAPTATTANIPNLTNGTTVYVVVSSVSTTASAGGGSESADSNEVSALIPFKGTGGCSNVTVKGNP